MKKSVPPTSVFYHSYLDAHCSEHVKSNFWRVKAFVMWWTLSHCFDADLYADIEDFVPLLCRFLHKKVFQYSTSSVSRRTLTPHPHGPFFISFFFERTNKKKKDFILNFWWWRCLLSSFFSGKGPAATGTVRAYPFIELTQNDTKITTLSSGSFSGAMFKRVFFYIFFLSILKGIKTYFINILQYLM